MARKAKGATDANGTTPAAEFPQDALLAEVRAEIGNSGYPGADFVTEGLSSLAVLLICHEMVQEAITLWAMDLTARPPDDPDEAELMGKPVYDLASAFGIITQACVHAGLFPESAVAGGPPE